MSSVVYPRDFFERRARLDPKLCFIISPFRAEYDGIRKVLDGIVGQCGFRAVHARDIQHSGVIHSDIWDHIQRAAVVIADVTEHNPNVFFELGVAATVKDKSRLIMIRRAAEADAFPFDISVFRCISYENTIESFGEMSEHVRAFLANVQAEDDFLRRILDRMKEWEGMDHEYELMLHVTELKTLRKRAAEETLPEAIAAYCFASSMYHKCDCRFWTDVNKDNIMLVDPMTSLICGRYHRPGYRAAYALQFISERVMKDCIDSFSARIRDKEFAARLGTAVVQLGVEGLVAQESGRHIPASETELLLADFRRWDLL